MIQRCNTVYTVEALSSSSTFALFISFLNLSESLTRLSLRSTASLLLSLDNGAMYQDDRIGTGSTQHHLVLQWLQAYPNTIEGYTVI